MDSNYDYCFEKVVGHEGGYTTNPKDRGNWTTGAIGRGVNKGTKFGVSAMAYPSLDIKNLTIAQAKEIYWEDYWKPSKASLLPAGVDFLAFDMAVNHGVGRSSVLLQRGANVADDGNIGPATLRAIANADRRDLLVNIVTARDKFFAELNNPTFEKGWLKRSNGVLLDAYDLYLKQG